MKWVNQLGADVIISMLSNILQSLNKRNFSTKWIHSHRTLIRGLSVPYFLAVLQNMERYEENSDYRHFSHSDFIYIKFGRRKDILFNLLISNFLFVFELFKILHQNENYWNKWNHWSQNGLKLVFLFTL